MHATLVKILHGKKLLIGAGVLLATLGGAHAYRLATGHCPLADLHHAVHGATATAPVSATAPVTGAQP